ncbi:MAG: hypothetical protein U0457_11920 [Candidatus Sericytochromatia bacterium]
MKEYLKIKILQINISFFAFICISFLLASASFSKDIIKIDTKLEKKLKEELKINPNKSDPKYSLADLYVNYLIKIENKNYNKFEIKNKLDIIEYNLLEACKIEKEAFCNYSYLILFLKNKFDILSEIDKIKFNRKDKRINQLLDILEEIIKNTSSLEDLNYSINILENTFKISGNNNKIGKFYIKTLNNYKKNFSKDKNITNKLDKIITTINKKINSNKNNLFNKKISTKDLLDELFFKFIDDELFEILYDKLEQENISEKIKNNYNEIEKLDILIKNNKNNATFISELGLYKVNLGQIDQGIELIKNAIEISPLDYMSFYKLALAYNIKNNYELTIKSLKDCLKIKPVFIEYIINDENFDNIKNLSDFNLILDNSEILKLKELKFKKLMSNFNDLKN